MCILLNIQTFLLQDSILKTKSDYVSLGGFLELFFLIFLREGRAYSIRNFIHSLLVLLSEQHFKNLSNGFKPALGLNLGNYILQFLTKTQFLFYFFYTKTNKRLLKYSRYKLPRYSICYFFIKPKRRFKKLFLIFKKSFLLSYESQKTFRVNVCSYLRLFLTNPKVWPGLLVLKKIHSFIFKKHRRRLFFNHKSVTVK